MQLFHNLLFLVLIIQLAACSSSELASSSMGSIPSQFDVELQVAPQGAIDVEASRRSELLHSYLAGQFSYVHEDFEKARAYFERTSALLESSSPQIHSLLAELYLRERRLEDARREAEAALAGAPESVPHRLLLAGISESLGDHAAAERHYKAVTDRSPKKNEPIVHEAYLLYAALLGRAERNEEGIALLERYRRVSQDNPVGLELLGRFYELQDRSNDAIRVYRLAIAKSGLNDTLFAALMRVYLRGNKGAEARALAEEKLRQEPNHALATRIIGELAISEGSVEEGLKYLRGAQNLLPNLKGNEKGASEDQASNELRFRIALLELERQDYKAAERELLLLLAQDAQHHEARYYLASIYAGSERIQDALTLLEEIPGESEVFLKSKMFAAYLFKQKRELHNAAKSLKQVLDREPRDMKARSYLIMILTESRDFDEAEQVILAGLKEFPEDERLLFQYGVILQELKREDEAFQVMERVIVINPDNSDALNFIAYTLAESGRELMRAERLALQAVDLRPNDAYYLDTLGWVYFQLEQYERAEELLAKAVSLVDKDSLIYEHYGDVLAKQGKHQQARSIYQAALAAFPDQPSDGEEESKKRIQNKLSDLP